MSLGAEWLNRLQTDPIETDLTVSDPSYTISDSGMMIAYEGFASLSL